MRKGSRADYLNKALELFLSECHVSGMKLTPKEERNARLIFSVGFGAGCLAVEAKK